MRGIFAALTLFTLVASPAAAHPHVWIEAEAWVTIEDRAIASVTHRWTFDAAFTAMNLAQAGITGAPTPDQLQALANAFRRSAGDYSFFTFLRTADGRIPVIPTTDVLTFENDQLVYSITTIPSQPAPAMAVIAIDIYDPAYFVAVYYVAPPSVTAKEGSCTSSFKPRPGHDPVMEARFADNPFTRPALPPALTKIAETYANRLTISCIFD